MAVLVTGVAAAATTQEPSDFKTSAQKDAYLRDHHVQTTGGLPVVKTDDGPATLTPEVLLYDQTSSASATGNCTSQNFEAIYDTFDNQAADDFLVTGSGWTVTTVFTPGVYSTSHTGASPAGMHVQFYNNAGGLPSGAPICDTAAATYVEAPAGTFTITVPGCVLSPGLKWVSVQANMAFLGGGGQWFWGNRTIVANSPATWQNPGGGFGTPCATWGVRGTCLAQADPDQVFSLSGTISSCTVDADCADGNLCNGVETCPAGACVAGTVVNCDDSLFCTIDACVPATGLCTHAVNKCSDGNGCNIDSCDEALDICGHAAAGAPTHLCNTGSITIRDGAPGALPYPSSITAAGLGSAGSLCSVELNGFTHTFPDDVDMMVVGPAGGSQNRTVLSDVGTGNDIAAVNLVLRDDAATSLPDSATIVSGTFKPTNIGAADPFAAPAPTPTGIALLAGAFENINPNGTWSLYIVDDSSTDTGTLTGGWCVNIIVSGCSGNAECSDGNPCNGVELCTAGTCAPGTPINCDDSDICTIDNCNPGTGLCEHPLFVCNDSNPCTTDTCVSPSTGCVFTDNTLPCDDGNPCTANDTCGGGACVSGPSNPCDDANGCTTDACDAIIGCYHSASTGGACDDSNACTTGDTCALPCTGSFSENFDSVTAPNLPAGWSTVKLAGLPADIAWRTAASTDTPPNGGNTDDVAHVTDKVLISPSLPAGATQVSFRNSWTLEASTTDATLGFDGGVLEIKIGTGAFTDIITAGGSFVSGGYTRTISTGFSSPIAGRMAWSGTQAAFITTTVNLPAAAVGQNVILRWRVATDSSVAGTGQTIDTITATTCASNCSGAPVLAPGEVTGDMFAPDKVTYSWSPAVAASQYDVVSGKTAFLPVGPGGGDEICFANIVGTSLVDGTTPAAGQGFWYLVRGENSCAAPGTYGNQSNGSPRITTTCP